MLLFSDSNIIFLGLPKINLVDIPEWPHINKNNQNDENDNLEVDVEIIEDENEEYVTNIDECNAIISLSQLKLLFHHCIYCNNQINETNLTIKKRGGILFISYWCSKCNRRRFWRSFNGPFIQLVTSASAVSGI